MEQKKSTPIWAVLPIIGVISFAVCAFTLGYLIKTHAWGTNIALSALYVICVIGGIISIFLILASGYVLFFKTMSGEKIYNKEISTGRFIGLMMALFFMALSWLSMQINDPLLDAKRGIENNSDIVFSLSLIGVALCAIIYIGVGIKKLLIALSRRQGRKETHIVFS